MIRKSELVNPERIKTRKEVKSLEKRIDEELKEYYERNGVLEVSLAHTPKSSVIEEIRRIYTAGGWQIKFFDNSDRCWLELE